MAEDIIKKALKMSRLPEQLSVDKGPQPIRIAKLAKDEDKTFTGYMVTQSTRITMVGDIANRLAGLESVIAQ